MKKKILVTAVFAFFSSAAFAGLYLPAELIIDRDNGFAQGDMLSVANSVNNDSFLGCGTRRFDNGFRFGFCQAGFSEEDRVTCFTFDEGLIDEIRAANDFSFITFNWVDDGLGNLTCTRVGFSTQSLYIDKIKN